MVMTRRKRLLGLAVLLLIGAVVLFRVVRLPDLAHIGAGYAAQQTCACLFIAGRSLDSCWTDLDPLAQRLVSVRRGPEQVTATSFGFSTATAQFEKGYGCSLRD
jgi:hypothetical protein